MKLAIGIAIGAAVVLLFGLAMPQATTVSCCERLAGAAYGKLFG